MPKKCRSRALAVPFSGILSSSYLSWGSQLDSDRWGPNEVVKEDVGVQIRVLADSKDSKPLLALYQALN